MMVNDSSHMSRDHRLRERIRDSRRHQRVTVFLNGRYMLEDRREFECHTVNMSPGGIALVAPVMPARSERVIAYLDCVGRIEGSCVRELDHGFAMSIKATPRRREKIAEQLTWLANQQILGIEDLRRFDRIVPRRLQTTLSFENGTNFPASIIDLSRSGVALVADCIPATGSVVYVGKRRGYVVRTLDQGFAVQFMRLIPFEMLDDEIEL